jgi:hypothetical protein
MPQIVHTPTAGGRHPLVATSGIVALLAASLVTSLVVVSVLFVSAGGCRSRCV